MPRFRVHFGDGTSSVLHASTPADARAMAQSTGPVRKIKLDRDRPGDTTRRPRLTRKAMETAGSC